MDPIKGLWRTRVRDMSKSDLWGRGGGLTGTLQVKKGEVVLSPHMDAFSSG